MGHQRPTNYPSTTPLKQRKVEWGTNDPSTTPLNQKKVEWGTNDTLFHFRLSAILPEAMTSATRAMSGARMRSFFTIGETARIAS